MKTILALDLGTKTGWALTEFGKITSGTQDFKATRFQSADRRFVNFKDWLNKTRDKTTLAKIDVVYFEEVRRHIGVDAAHCYGGFKAILTTFCQENEISFQGMAVGTIKKHITGNGAAKKDKMIAAVRALGYNPKDDNEADAISLLHAALAGGKD